MPRISRAIAVGYPHHITQRGNYRQTVFAAAEDYARYLELLNQYARKHSLDIWAYCLMPNHVHIVGVPGADDSLASVFRTVHMLYSQYYNHKSNAVGHLWQGRYYSCALDEPHVHAAVRYVEMNPVRGGIIASAEDYPWSSAKSHVTGIADPILSGGCFLVETIRDWKQYLAEAPNETAGTKLMDETNQGNEDRSSLRGRWFRQAAGGASLPKICNPSSGPSLHREKRGSGRSLPSIGGKE